ncbi:MAG TPA: hypothetical protein VK348_11960, partial [Planctomycetota bacterium]|nr:hypothetical protein [Planctomycetota bacterium]
MPLSQCLQVCSDSESTPDRRRFGRKPLRIALAAGLLLLAAAGTAIVTDLSIVGRLHRPAATHLDQATLLNLVQQGQPAAAFAAAFHQGDVLFETSFNALDGVGANVGQGQRFTHVPRADLVGPGEWANHVPSRATGPNAESCNACHNQAADDGSGRIVGNAHRDPFHTGSVGSMIQRNTPHLFAAGAVQRLAEEMTVALRGIREQLVAQVRQTGLAASAALRAKGVDFGRLAAAPSRFHPGGVAIDNSRIDGLDADLVVKPFQWKGSVRFVRDFNRDAAHNELGMQAVELVGAGVDGDGDGVVDELSIGDMTALAVYVAAQPRPVTRIELSALGLIPQLTPAEVAAIQRGAGVFAQIGCVNCHVPSLPLDDPTFCEPSTLAAYRDASFPSGASPVAFGVRPDLPIRFDLTQDQPDNIVQVGGRTVHLGS